MAIAPTPLVVLHAFWTLYMVNSFQFTRSASFILAHRKATEEKTEEHGKVSFMTGFPCPSVFSSVPFRVPKTPRLIFTAKDIRQTTDRFQRRLLLAALLPAADLATQTRQRHRLHDAAAGAG